MIFVCVCVCVCVCVYRERECVSPKHVVNRGTVPMVLVYCMCLASP